MASNKKFNDAAVGYRPQTAFPLNANEYFESVAEAEAAAQRAAEVGTPEADNTSYYIGQTLTVYEKKWTTNSDSPVTGYAEFQNIAQDAVDRNIPVVLVTIKGSIAEPAQDCATSRRFAQLLTSDVWQRYVRSNSGRFYFAYGQTAVDQDLYDSVSRQVPSTALTAWYGESDWGEDLRNSYDKIGVVYGVGETASKGFVSPAGIADGFALTAFVDGIIGHVKNAELAVFQIQPDRTLKPAGGGEIPDTYKTYAETVTALTAEDGFKTYAETSAALSNDGYATQAWVQEQGFVGGDIGLSDIHATIFDFGNGDLSSFGWKDRIDAADLVAAGIKFSGGTVFFKNPIAIRIGSDITSIGENTFRQGSSDLTSVTIPDSVTSIGNSAFFYCTGLSSVTIPNSVTSIGNFAFDSCIDLSEVTIPDSVTSIGNSAFLGCNSLSEIRVEGKTQAEAEALLANANVPTGCQIKTWNFEPKYDCIPKFEQMFTKVNLAGRKLYYPKICQDELRYGGDDIFWRVMFLRSVDRTEDTVYSVNDEVNQLTVNMLTAYPYMTIDWPYRVDDYLSVQNGSTDIDVILRGYVGGYPNIPAYAFYGRNDMTIDLDLYQNARTLDRSALGGCNRLTGVTIPDGVTDIGPYAFQDCSSLTGIAIPANTLSIGSGAFRRCGALSAVTFRNGLKRIRNSAFAYCSSLTGIAIPDSVTYIDTAVFAYCSNLSGATLGNGLTNIGSSMFRGCGSLISITVPDGVEYIKDRTFEDCSSLANVRLGDNTKGIGISAFYKCEKLSGIDIPDSVISVGDYAFEYCKSLISVTIPNSVEKLGNQAFADCSKLQNVTIGSGLSSYLSWYIFHNCSDLTSISVDPGSVNYQSVNNLLLSKDGKWLYQGVNGHVTIPEGVKSILDCAFSGRKNLSSVNMPNSLNSIRSYAFWECTKLSSINIPNAVTAINDWAFGECSRLSNMTIPDHVSTIGEYAFDSCSRLKKITIKATGTPDATLSGNVKTKILEAGLSEYSGITWTYQTS